MAELHKVYTYAAGKTHWAVARRVEELAAVSTPEQLTPAEWWYWRAICGKDLVGRSTESSSVLADYDVDCRSCVRTLKRSAEVYQKLVERFGG